MHFQVNLGFYWHNLICRTLNFVWLLAFQQLLTAINRTVVNTSKLSVEILHPNSAQPIFAGNILPTYWQATGRKEKRENNISHICTTTHIQETQIVEHHLNKW
jgi:hypothetical protein